MKGTKWTDKGDGNEYTYESQGQYMQWDYANKKFEKVIVVVLSTDLLPDMTMVIPMILFHKNFVPAASFVDIEDNPTTTH